MLYKIILHLTIVCMLGEISQAQYAPPPGQPGTSAIAHDSSAIIQWATGCTVQRGPMSIAKPAGGNASAGEPAFATGMAGSNGTVSLGDGGSATLTFQYPITNGAGHDFAVFENSFDDTFLELAFVEVSSDGILFYRFHAVSLTDTSSQVDPFGSTEATKINNLAGKYRGLYGTPFDLEELKNEPGLDVRRITHVRITDVVGCIQNAYTARDYNGRPVNDPWPTDFASGGFDLDGVAVLHAFMTGINDTYTNGNYSIYPNPVKAGAFISLHYNPREPLTMQLFNLSGQKVKEQLIGPGNNNISTLDLEPGIYFLKAAAAKGILVKKIIVTE